MPESPYNVPKALQVPEDRQGMSGHLKLLKAFGPSKSLQALNVPKALHPPGPSGPLHFRRPSARQSPALQVPEASGLRLRTF